LETTKEEMVREEDVEIRHQATTGDDKTDLEDSVHVVVNFTV
jgi:hypothetical protein